MVYEVFTERNTDLTTISNAIHTAASVLESEWFINPFPKGYKVYVNKEVTKETPSHFYGKVKTTFVPDLETRINLADVCVFVCSSSESELIKNTLQTALEMELPCLLYCIEKQNNNYCGHVWFENGAPVSRSSKIPSWAVSLVDSSRVKEKKSKRTIPKMKVRKDAVVQKYWVLPFKEGLKQRTKKVTPEDVKGLVKVSASSKEMVDFLNKIILAGKLKQKRKEAKKEGKKKNEVSWLDDVVVLADDVVDGGSWIKYKPENAKSAKEKNQATYIDKILKHIKNGDLDKAEFLVHTLKGSFDSDYGEVSKDPSIPKNAIYLTLPGTGKRKEDEFLIVRKGDTFEVYKRDPTIPKTSGSAFQSRMKQALLEFTKLTPEEREQLLKDWDTYVTRFTQEILANIDKDNFDKLLDEVDVIIAPPISEEKVGVAEKLPHIAVGLQLAKVLKEWRLKFGKEELNNLLKELDMPLTKEQEDQLEKFMEKLEQWNLWNESSVGALETIALGVKEKQIKKILRAAKAGRNRISPTRWTEAEELFRSMIAEAEEAKAKGEDHPLLKVVDRFKEKLKAKAERMGTGKETELGMAFIDDNVSSGATVAMTIFLAKYLHEYARYELGWREKPNVDEFFPGFKKRWEEINAQLRQAKKEGKEISNEEIKGYKNELTNPYTGKRELTYKDQGKEIVVDDPIIILQQWKRTGEKLSEDVFGKYKPSWATGLLRVRKESA